MSAEIAALENSDLVRQQIARDERLQLVRQWLDVEAELRDSPTWAFIMDQAQKLRAQALEGLAGTDPENVAEIRRLQNEAALPVYIQTWVQRLFSGGENAERSIRDEEGESPSTHD
jgi:hypothetical protein